jgi:hypothetical protein
MSDLEDRKIREVAVAQYVYRHEAEFAAGFLDNAGIPYRLQIDDPVMGLTVSAPATIWVRGLDLAEASDILDVENSPRLSRPAPGRLAQAPVRPRSRGVTRRARDGGARPSGFVTGNIQAPQLDLRERALALTGSVVVMTAGRLLLGEISDGLMVGTAVVGAGLFLVALFGRCPAGLRRLLRALSGSAP